MPLRLHVPPPPLSDFVEVMCLCENYRPGHAKERILPDGGMTLIINLREDRLRLYDRDDPRRFATVGGSLLSGARSEFHIIDTACQEFIVTVHFKPGGAFPFLAMPADEIGDSQAALGDVWGTRDSELREQLLEAVTPMAKFTVLEAALLSRMRRPEARHPAVEFALRQFQRLPHSESVSDVIERTGLSKRHFIQVFSEEVGITPKRFSRLHRFRDVLGIIGQAKEVDWAGVALTCGYYDQAHFIHNFRAFSGLKPTEWLKVRGEHVNHVPLSG